MAQLRGLPEPEGPEQLRPPAIEGLPSAGPGRGSSPEPGADLGGAENDQVVLNQSHEDRRTGVPAPWMNLVGKDAGDSLAGEAEEAPDKNDRALRGIGEA